MMLMFQKIIILVYGLYFIIWCIFSSAPDSHAARREFLSYCLSLMRAHNSEHGDSLPVLDVSSLRHVAYVFDALIYYMRSGSEQSVPSDDTIREGPSTANDAWNQQVGNIRIISFQLSAYYCPLEN